MRFSWIVLGVLVLCGPASAEWTAKDALRAYNSGDAELHAIALGQMLGIESAYGYANSRLKTNGQVQFYCQPAIGLGDQQVMLILQQYLKTHDFMAKYPVGLVAQYALAAAFPCPKGSD